MISVLVAMLLCGSAFAEEDPARPDTPEQAAERVLAALGAKDAAALKALAEHDAPEPGTEALVTESIRAMNRDGGGAP